MLKRVLLPLTVVVALVIAAVGGGFAGFVDTERSTDNFVQAGISDLLINGMNDPHAKVTYTHLAPCKDVSFWIDVYNWGECQGGYLYMHFTNVNSEEDGVKEHNELRIVYDGVETQPPAGVPDGYREAVGDEPKGAGVWSSEPEKIAEVGGGYISCYYINATTDAIPDPNLLGEDYASGVADHLDVRIEVPYVGATGNELGDPDTNGDGMVDSTERAAWEAAGNRFEDITALTGKLADVECNKAELGFLPTQQRSYIHLVLHLQQIYAEEWINPDGTLWQSPTDPAPGVDYDCDGDVDDDDLQKAGWPTNALQGDKATFDMEFELITDP